MAAAHGTALHTGQAPEPAEPIPARTAPLALIRRDLLRLIRNPGRTSVHFAIPLVLAAVMVLVFGGSGPPQITIRLLVWNEDQGVIGRFLAGAGTQSGAGDRLDLVQVGPEGLQMMDEGDPASALIHLPATFSEDFLAGRPVTIELIKSPSQRFLPQLVQEGVSVGAEVLDQISRSFRTELSSLGSMLDRDALPAQVEVAVMAGNVVGSLHEIQRFVLPPIVGLETVTTGEEAPTTEASADDATTTDSQGSAMAEILGYFLPGLAMLAALFLAQSVTRDMMADREAGLLRHLLTAPVTAGQYLLGKTMSVILISALGFGLMIVLGMLAGVSWGPPLAVALLTLASAAAIAGLLVLLMSLATTQRQGDAMSTVVIIMASMLGGAFIPLTQIPGFLRPVSAASPVFWCVDGFNELMLRGGDLGGILLHISVLSAAGAMMLGLGTWRLGRSLRGGA